jgi:hypothetical protein
VHWGDAAALLVLSKEARRAGRKARWVVLADDFKGASADRIAPEFADVTLIPDGPLG